MKEHRKYCKIYIKEVINKKTGKCEINSDGGVFDLPKESHLATVKWAVTWKMLRTLEKRPLCWLLPFDSKEYK